MSGPTSLLGRTTSRNSRRIGRYLPIVALAVAALAVAPTEATAPHVSQIAYTAPYLHGRAQHTILREVVGCRGTGAVTTAHRFNASTGILHWSATTATRACALGEVNQGSFMESNLEVTYTETIPVQILNAGAHSENSFYVTVNGSATGRLTHALGGCPNASAPYGYAVCELEAYSGYESTAVLVDLTNGSVVYPSNYSPIPQAESLYEQYNVTVCGALKCSATETHTSVGGNRFSGNTSVTWDIPARTNSAHEYEIQVELDAFAEVVLAGYGPRARATASIDLVGPSHGLQIAIIVEQ